MLAVLVDAGRRIRSAADAQLAASSPLRLHLEGDAPVRTPVAVAPETPSHVRREVTPEETHPPVTVELEDVFVLVAT